MSLSCTVFEILTAISKRLKRSPLGQYIMHAQVLVSVTCQSADEI